MLVSTVFIPNEMLLIIFSYLNVEEKIIASKVCKIWYCINLTHLYNCKILNKISWSYIDNKSYSQVLDIDRPTELLFIGKFVGTELFLTVKRTCWQKRFFHKLLLKYSENKKKTNNCFESGNDCIIREVLKANIKRLELKVNPNIENKNKAALEFAVNFLNSQMFHT